MTLQPEYIVDNSCQRTKVILDYKSYLELLEIAEDAEDSKLINETSNDEVIQFSTYKAKRNFV